MRATYACGELSATSSSTSISFTTAARELALVLGHEQDAGRRRRRARPLDHHRDARGLEPAAQDLGLQLGPLAELDEPAVVVVVGIVEPSRCAGSLGHERDPAVGALRGAGAVLGAARRAPHARVDFRVSTVGRVLRRVRRYDGECPMPRDASTSRRSAARRTPSTPTRSSRRCSPTGSSPPTDAGGRRPRRRQHVRVHRGGAPGVDRRRARAGRRASGPAPSSWSPVAWPSATATSSPPRCPRPTRSSGSRAKARSPTSCCAAQAGGRARPARAAAARAERAVGVREGRRGLRPRVRVLRDPVVPRRAALAHAGVDRGRSARRSSSRASPRSCSSRRTSRGTAATSASPVRSRRCCAGSTRSRRRPRARPAALPLSVRGARPARRDDARAADRRAVLRPLAAARGAADCCGA